MTTQPASRIAAVLRELGKLELGPHREAVHDIVANIAELHAHCDELEAEIDRLRAERDRLAAFARKFIAANVWDNLGEWDGGDVQDVARKMGLLVAVPGGYDPDKHGCDAAHDWGSERGDPYYEFAPFLRDGEEDTDG